MDKKQLDEEYLSRPELNVNFEYNQFNIYIASEHTCYLRFEKMVKLNQKDLLDSYSKIIKLCREMGIKIKYGNKYKKFITENWKNYIATYDEYNAQFKHLVSMLPKLQDRGIHRGTSDDMYLKEIYDYREQINSYYYRNSILFQMKYIYHELGRIENDLVFEKNCANPERHICGKTLSITL